MHQKYEMGIINIKIFILKMYVRLEFYENIFFNLYEVRIYIYISINMIEFSNSPLLEAVVKKDALLLWAYDINIYTIRYYTVGYLHYIQLDQKHTKRVHNHYFLNDIFHIDVLK